MIGWHARVYQRCNLALSVTSHTNGVTPEHAGALHLPGSLMAPPGLGTALTRTAAELGSRK
jgi:hypothetical protein